MALRKAKRDKNKVSSGFTHEIQLSLKSPECGPMLAAPFLQYSDLTPGQKRYLCSVCKAYSEAHMRKLMQQHYLNVLRRSMRGGNVISNTQLRMFLPALGHSSTQEKERSEGKVQEQKDKNGSRKMSVLPKINSQHKRSPESIKRKSRPGLKKKNHGLI
ncbi:hypothetical protein Q7C36_018593 [Tachysurus vachellii]|uniref:Uncharacterized protein n=1 Tax=Tachysurus vachellii TaxID=175792 RepID=A0AA88S5Z6_TACVA|nr:hypothetical protein Q7C36_018593 [Tachysurus vachellii]